MSDTTHQSGFVKPNYTNETITFNFKTEHDFLTDFKPLVATHGLFKCHNTRKNVITEDLIKYRAHKAVKTEYWTCDHAFKKRARKIIDDPNIKRRKTKKASKKTECKAKFTKIFFADDTIEVRYNWKHTGHDPVTDIKPKKRKLIKKDGEQQVDQQLDDPMSDIDDGQDIDVEGSENDADQQVEALDRNEGQQLNVRRDLERQSERVHSDELGRVDEQRLEMSSNELSKDQEQQSNVRLNNLQTNIEEVRYSDLDRVDEQHVEVRSNEANRNEGDQSLMEESNEDLERQLYMRSDESGRARIEELDKDEAQHLDVRSGSLDRLHLPTRIKRSSRGNEQLSDVRSSGSERDDKQQLDARLKELDNEIENLKRVITEKIEGTKLTKKDESKKEKIERLQLFIHNMQDLVSNLQKDRIPQNE